MKKLLFVVILLFSIINVHAQSNFDNGFKSGFNNGYCYSNQASGTCYPPVPPIPPLPQLNESRDSYNDGYNRGFLYGQAQRKNDDNYSSKQSNVSSNPPKFNQYVPQSPIPSLTSEQRDAYYAAKARRDQEAAQAMGMLIEAVFTVNHESRAQRKARRELRKARRELRSDSDNHTNNKMQRKIDKLIRQSHIDSKF